MNRISSILALVLLNSSLMLAGGCSSPPTRFYVLSSLPSAQPLRTGQDIVVGVGPVELPEYLDRPQIVTRSGQNELTLAEFDRWAESLKDNTTQVLAEDLAILLPSKKVSTYPWRRSTAIDYQLVVKVTRFDHTAGGETVLAVRWSLLSGDGKELLSRESRYVERQPDDAYGSTVAAMNRSLGQFSRDVASAITGQIGSQ